jgi:hypothetical protein
MIQLILGVVMMTLGAALVMPRAFNWYFNATQGGASWWYEFWERRGWLKADQARDRQRRVFRIVMPVSLLLVGFGFVMGGIQSLLS